MDGFISYILISTTCLSVFYLGYLLLLRKENRFNYLRYFLLISMALSVVTPLSTYQIELDIAALKYDTEEIHQKKANTFSETVGSINIQEITIPKSQNSWNISSLLTLLYLIGLMFFGMRIIIHLLKLFYLYCNCEKNKNDNVTILSNHKITSPFTFFRWIFIPPKYLNDDEKKDILIHEKIHATQHHSIDLIFIELLAAFMWFNPLVWKMKKSIQLVHEYLADKGVLNSGTDKLNYQALLINQVAEEKLICLASNFNNSLIKKRILMMTKTKFNKGSKLRILALIPLATILFIGVSFVNGEDVYKNAKPLTVIIDAGHGGKDPGAMLNSEIKEKDFSLSIAKILKEKGGSNTKINLIFTREKDEFLELNKRIASNADLLISIHSSFSENNEDSGIDCIVAKESNYKDQSETIGKLLIGELSQLNGINTKTSLKEANLMVLKESNCPALLLNLGYISNSNDLNFISNKHNQSLICDKILNAINQFSEIMPAGK